MPDPAWPCSPPELNYMRLAGDGAAGTATTLASAAAWQALTVGNEVAFSLSSLNTAVTAVDFQGVGGASSSAAAGELNTSLQMLAGWTQEKPPVVSSAVSAYETALAAMIPAEIAVANRTEQAADVAMNPLVFGALTPAIVALDTQYFGEFWPQNASAGAAYGATLAGLAAALAVPPPLAPSGSPAAPVAAAAAVAQEGAQTMAGQAMQQAAQQAATMTAQQSGSAASQITQPLQQAMGMFQSPMQSLGGLDPALTDSLDAMAPYDDLESGMPFMGVGALPAASGSVGAPSFSSGSLGSGASPGAGLTSYVRPSTAFPTENGGKPVGLKPGPLNTAELRGPTAVGPMPMAPPGSARTKEATKEEDTARARVTVRKQPVPQVK